MKKMYRIMIISVLLLLAGTLTTFAVDDIEAPVFNPNIQTMYLLQRKDDGSTFIPEEVIKNVTATDNVDGSDVTISLDCNTVDISQDGQYQLLYTATDKAGNASSLIITVIVDGMGPVFDENEETIYYMNKEGIVFDSEKNIVESLPKNLVAKDSMGAYIGIGVYITNDSNGDIIFVGTIENSPAVNLLEMNDILLEIDGENVKGQSAAYAASKIKGEGSDSVLLKILRNGQELTITVPKALVKLYADQEFIAEPDIDINSINKDVPGTIEIKFTATDATGNTTEFVIKVIVMEEEEHEEQAIPEDEDSDSEETNSVTTSGNPPENITIEIPTDTELVEDKEETIVEELDEDEAIEIPEELED